MNELELLLQKIGCKDLLTLKEWYSENDDAFFDSYYELWKEGYLNRNEFNTLLKLVGERGEV